MSGLVQRGEAGARENSEVLVVMHKVGLVLSVDELTGLLYILGHSWRAAAEYPKLPYLSSVSGESDCREKERPTGLKGSFPRKKLLLKPGWNDQGINPRPQGGGFSWGWQVELKPPSNA